MKITHIADYILENYNHVNPLNSWGEKSFFVNPNNKLKRGTYFMTIKEKDGENDKSSNLNREGIFRLNIGVDKELYLNLFGSIPKRPNKGCVIDGNYNFDNINELMPHPIYAWMGWICILNPDIDSFEKCKPMIENAYIKAINLTNKKIK